MIQRLSHRTLLGRATRPGAGDRKAFTLLELVVAIVILGVLAALAIPTFSNLLDTSQLKADTDSATNVARAAVAQAGLDDNSATAVDPHAAVPGSTYLDEAAASAGATPPITASVAAGEATVTVRPGHPCTITGIGVVGGTPRAACTGSGSGSGSGTTTTTTTPLPPGPTVMAALYPSDGNVTLNGLLDAVSCPTTTTCVAVGAYLDNTSGYHLIADTKSSGTWSTTTIPMPAALDAGQYLQLTAISCGSATDCVAVGNYPSGGNQMGMIATLHAGVWTMADSVQPSDFDPTNGAFLYSVSCPTATTCVAVGGYAQGSIPGSPRGPLVDTLSAGTWTAMSPALAPGAMSLADNPSDATLNAVSCPTTTNCVAAGPALRTIGYQETTAIYTLTAGTWSAAILPLSSSWKEFQTISGQTLSCPTTTDCVLVGVGQDAASTTLPTIATLAAGSWTVAQAPAPAGSAQELYLSGVSCAAPGECQALSSSWDGVTTRAVVLSAVGGVWTAVNAGPAPSDVDPASTAPTGLSGVSCATTSSCAAVGTYNYLYVTHPGDLHWLPWAINLP